MQRHMIGVDKETYDRLDELAEETHRTIVGMIRAMVANVRVVRPGVTVEIEDTEEKDAA